MTFNPDEVERMIRGIVHRLEESEAENRRLQTRLSSLETWADQAPAYIDNQRVGSRLAEIDAKLTAAMQLKQGPPGPEGKRGQPGPDGRPGPPGADAGVHVIREVKIVG